MKQEESKGKKADQDKIKKLYEERSRLNDLIKPLENIVSQLQAGANKGESIGQTARRISDNPQVNIMQINNISGGNPAAGETGAVAQ